MKRTTIFVPEPLERDLQLYARREGKAVASVVREAVAEYLAARAPASALPSFTGMGDSGRTDVAEHHEDLLWRDPHGSGRRVAPLAQPSKRSARRKSRR